MSDYEAAVHLLRAPTIRERLAEAVTWPIAGSDGWGGINWEEITRIADEQFSDGELVLVNAAAALFSGRGKVVCGDQDLHSATLPHLLQWLDEPLFTRVMQAVQLKRGESKLLAAGRIYAGRLLNAGDHSSGMVWVIEPDGIGSELTLHTPKGAASPKSPDGHAWGYGGSGAAQLAMDLLWSVAGQEPHPECYQEFKREVIAPLEGESWVISEATVVRWLDDFSGQRFLR